MFDTSVPDTYLLWLEELVRRWNRAVDQVYAGDDQREALRNLRVALLSSPAPNAYAGAQRVLAQLLDATLEWATTPSDARWRRVQHMSVFLQEQMTSLKNAARQITRLPA